MIHEVAGTISWAGQGGSQRGILCWSCRENQDLGINIAFMLKYTCVCAREAAWAAAEA